MKKPTPMLDPKKRNEQNIEDQDNEKEPNSKPKDPIEPVKEDPEKIPESNDPAGYDEPGNIKKSPYKKK